MMKHLSSTPLGRRAMSHDQNSQPDVDKWHVLQQLRLIRTELGLSDRSLSVLAALLSFHPARELTADQPLIVWPSNATLSQRANGMPESTLRRHLTHLIEAGLITRHASPNGKRYARRTLQEVGLLAYGFCLHPLRQRSGEFDAMAHEVELRAIAIRDLRDTITLTFKRIELILPVEQQAQLDILRKSMRRALPLLALQQLLKDAQAFEKVYAVAEMSSTDAQNERHIQESNHINIDKAKDENQAATLEGDVAEAKTKTPLQRSTSIQNLLEKALSRFPQLQSFYPDNIQTWADYQKASEVIAPMIGLNPRLLARAKQTLGLEGASITVSALLQRFDKIANPSAYLNHLLKKAEAGRFSPEKLVTG